MIAGIGGAVLAAAGALAAGAPLSLAVVCYMAGGSVVMLVALAVGICRPPPVCDSGSAERPEPGPPSGELVSGGT